MVANNDNIQFRGETEKAASRVVDELRLGGINVNELARQGLREKLREALSDEEKITLHQRYKQGDLSEDVAAVLLGDTVDEIERGRTAFEEATELDRTRFEQLRESVKGVPGSNSISVGAGRSGWSLKRWPKSLALPRQCTFSAT